MDELKKALAEHERMVHEATDRLVKLAARSREEAEDHESHENDAEELKWTLRRAEHLLSCLRRLVAGRTSREIHDAFGAPGDFGYDTPIGDALYRVYSTPPKGKSP